MIHLAKTDPVVVVRPENLDTHPYLLNVANGTVDLKTGKLRPHDRADLLTKIAPVDYDPAAGCGEWEKFLARVLPDADVRAYLQKAVGYSLTGSISEQKMFIAHGPGANGKSTFLELLATMLGDYGQSAPMDTFIVKKHGGGIPHDVARMVGARFISTVEANEGVRFNESLVKQLTGGDRISARFLYQEFFDFTPTHKLWLSVNHKPEVRGTDHAIWRRLVLLPFDVVILEAERDARLGEKLRAELPGILAWAVRGCLAWQADGLKAPDTMVRAAAEYKEENDTIATFIEDCTTRVTGAKMTKLPVFERYVRWCHTNNEQPLTSRAFSIRLAEHGVQGRPQRENAVLGRGRDDRGSPSQQHADVWSHPHRMTHDTS